MMSAKLFETMHDLCCYATTDAAKRQLPFAGKSVFLCGNLFQLPAVESPQLYQSPLWNKFVMVELKENCRQSDDQKYGEVLNRICTGDHTSNDFGYLANVPVGLVTKGVSTVSSQITVLFCAPRTSTRTGSIWACSTLFTEIVSL